MRGTLFRVMEKGMVASITTIGMVPRSCQKRSRRSLSARSTKVCVKD